MFAYIHNFKHAMINAAFADLCLCKFNFCMPYLLSVAWFVYNFEPQK